MPAGTRLLKQLRRATSSLKQHGLSPAQESLLGLIDIVVDELLLREDASFYLQYITQGNQLLNEGLPLARSAGGSLPNIALPRADFGPETRHDVLSREIRTIHRGLAAVAGALNESRSASEKDYLSRLSRWESGLYRHRLEAVADTKPVQEVTIAAEAFAAYLAQKFPERSGIKVTRFVPLHGGLSKLTVLFETQDGDGKRQELVLRAGKPTKLLHLDGSDVTYEYHTLKLMHEAGLPVPEPLWLESDASCLGMPFLVSRMAEGRNVGSSLSAVGDMDPAIPASALETLACIHQVRLDATNPSLAGSQMAEWLPYKTIRDTALHFARVLLPQLVRRARIEPSPQLARVMRWLAANAPECDEPPVIVHNDFGYHNLLYVGNKVSAVLDWEMARMGDPADDIACTQQILGAWSMEEFLERYRQLTGRRVSAYRIAYAKVAYCALVHIGGLTTLLNLDEDENAPIQIAGVAFKVMSMFGANFDELIVEAEKAREAVGNA